MMTLREMVLEATPVGREFTIPELVKELFPNLKTDSVEFRTKRLKINSIIRSEKVRWDRFEYVDCLDTPGRPVLWRRCSD